MLRTEEGKTEIASGTKQFPERIILTGFRATGKSVVAKYLASLLDYRFVDTDEAIVAQLGCSIARYVAQNGWQSFRELERKLLERLALMAKTIIATGGGSVMHDREWNQLRKNSLTVWLQADAGTIKERLVADPVSREQRPPLKGMDGQDEVESVLAEREASYRRGSDMAIDTSGKSPEEIALMIKNTITYTEKA